MALVTDKVPEGYLREMRQLMMDISNGDATWSNANDIRKKYGLPSLTIDTIRRGALLYSEFNASGWVNEPVNKNIPTKNTTTLDSDWFNENNPYWSRMLYTLDYLNLENQIDSTRFKLFGPSSTQSYTAEVITTPAESPISVRMQTKSGTSVNFISDNGFYINPFDIQFGVKQYINDYNGSIHQGYIRLLDETAVKFKIEIYNKSGDTLNIQKTFYYWTSGANSPNIYNNESDIYNVKNFIDNRLEDSSLSGYGEATATYSTTIPQLFVPGVYTEGAVMKITMYYYNRPGANGTSALYELFFEDDLGEQYRSIFPGWDNGNTRDDRYPWGWGTIYSQTAAGESEYITISTLYKNESPLFELILQYTKMFGLCWDVDYGNKEIKILTRKNLFKNYTVTNWDNKLDRKKLKNIVIMSI